MKLKVRIILHCLILVLVFPSSLSAKGFLHPGIYQTSADLEYMRKQAIAGAQPWKDAFDRLVAETDLNFQVKTFAHVLRGSYGRPNIGGEDLRKGAGMAYNCALLWYITGEKAYAEKAIEIINSWSAVLWDFDYNDAKLLAGWTGHLFCNAAEILRYTDSGWEEEEVEQFKNMLMSVYYPLLRFYYPQANGNWDGAIIQSVMAIAIFTDNAEMFDNALNHFLYAPYNGSIFKYIWPNGQCQESTRDQAHVQLGLGEFAGAARIAFSQGIDLFSIGNNRIAAGYEFTAGFLMGEKPFSYGFISERAKDIRDDYEYVYRHYSAMGVDVPFTRQAADFIRHKTTRSALTAFRAPEGIKGKVENTVAVSYGYPANAIQPPEFPKESFRVNPAESIQEALDKASGTGRWVVVTAGVHSLPAPLRMPSDVVLAGEGLSTVLFLEPSSGAREAIVNASPDIQNVTIRDLLIEGATSTEVHSDPNSRRVWRSTAIRAGIMLMGEKDSRLKNINLHNVTVQNCTWNGVYINGVDNLSITACNFNENGSSVVPGPRLQHNLLITRCTGVTVSDSRLVNSPYGCGLAIAHSREVKVRNCEISRNGWYGLLITESEAISVEGNLIEGNDRSAVMAEYLFTGSSKISVSGNTIQYNNGYGIESYAAQDISADANLIKGNRSGEMHVSREKKIIMN
jgi:hypothetical protein